MFTEILSFEFIQGVKKDIRDLLGDTENQNPNLIEFSNLALSLNTYTSLEHGYKELIIEEVDISLIYLEEFNIAGSYASLLYESLRRLFQLQEVDAIFIKNKIFEKLINSSDSILMEFLDELVHANLHPSTIFLATMAKIFFAEFSSVKGFLMMAGALLDAAKEMLNIGIPSTTISDSFQRAASHATQVLEEISTPVDLENDEELIKLASTYLNSKFVSQHSLLFAPLAVKAVKRIYDPTSPDYVNLNMIKLVKKLGETVEVEMINGAFIEQKSMERGGPSRIDEAKIGLIQFQIPPPETTIDNFLNEFHSHIKEIGCNILLIQESLLCDAVTEKALDFFAKMKIMVIKVEQEDIEFCSKILGCCPVTLFDHFVPEVLGSADLVEEIRTSFDEAVIKVTGLRNPGQVVSILLRGSNKLNIHEADRSLHDALCVIRCFGKAPALLPGGGAPEMKVAVELKQVALTKTGAVQNCWRAYANAMEFVSKERQNIGLKSIESTVRNLKLTSYSIEAATNIVQKILALQII